MSCSFHIRITSKERVKHSALARSTNGITVRCFFPPCSMPSQSNEVHSHTPTVQMPNSPTSPPLGQSALREKYRSDGTMCPPSHAIMNTYTRPVQKQSLGASQPGHSSSRWHLWKPDRETCVSSALKYRISNALRRLQQGGAFGLHNLNHQQLKDLADISFIHSFYIEKARKYATMQYAHEGRKLSSRQDGVCTVLAAVLGRHIE